MKTSLQVIRERLRTALSAWKHEAEICKSEAKRPGGLDARFLQGKIAGFSIARRDVLDVLRDPRT